MATGQVTIFPDWMTLFWTLVNLVILLVIPGALVLGVVYMMRLSRRVKRIEDQLHRKDEQP